MPILKPLPIKTRGKSAFGRLKAWITEVRTWEVAENWEYQLDPDTRIIIPKGFVFDGASIPRILWAVLSPTGLLLIQGLIHDFGYKYDYLWAVNKGEGEKYIKIYEGKGQDFWDELFYRVGREVNEMKVINALAWLPLSLFGFIAWNNHRDNDYDDLKPE
ncbi:MAG: DUF1353 domain-containing protein [Neptuniibacter sp.]|nr:DUF1353 domain-containing protein [Neptuniibacter sp.]